MRGSSSEGQSAGATPGGAGRPMRLRQQLPIVGIAGAATSALNFGYQVIAANQLPPEAYGLFASLMAIITAVAAAFSGLQVLAARSVSTGLHWIPEPRYVDKATRQVFAFGIVLALIGVGASGPLSDLLHTTAWAVGFMAAAFPVLGVQALVFGRIQGSGAVYIVALIGLIVAVAKIASASLALGAGLGVSSLVLLFVVSNAGGIAFGAHRASHSGQVQQSLVSMSALVIVTAQASYWLLASLDVFFARIAMPELDAGVFAAAATIAKSVLFLPGLITALVLPKAGSLFGDKSAREILGRRALLATAVITTIGAFAIWIFGPVFLALVLGEEYADGGAYIGQLAFAYIPIALSGVVLQFHFTSMRKAYGFTALAVTVSTAVWLSLAPGSPSMYVVAMAVSGSMLFILLLLERTQPMRAAHLVWRRGGSISHATREE